MTCQEIVQDLAELLSLQAGNVIGPLSHPHATSLFFKLFATAYAQDLTATVLTAERLRDAVTATWVAEGQDLRHPLGLLHVQHLDAFLPVWAHWHYALTHIDLYMEAA